MENSDNAAKKSVRVRIWDLPTRLFHWVLTGLVITSFITAEIGGNLMLLHMRAGYTILTLLVFRLIWGILGGYHSRFTSFLHGPIRVFQYAASLLRKDSPHHPGHNPMGGWSVAAMLGSLLVQAATGLFANDDIFIEGPLYPWVSKAVSDQLTRIHQINELVIMTLVIFHLGAVFFYLIFKKENLILPMITGDKILPESVPLSDDRKLPALLIFVLVGIAVYFLVR